MDTAYTLHDLPNRRLVTEPIRDRFPRDTPDAPLLSGLYKSELLGKMCA